jgi:Ca2+-binding RTX toxin-like protein
MSGGDGSYEIDAYSDTADPSGSAFFTLTVNPDGTYDFTLESNSLITRTEIFGADFSAGGPQSSLTSPDGVLTITGYIGGVADLVNPQNNGFGVDNPKMNPGERLDFTFNQLQTNVSFQVVNWSGTGDANEIHLVFRDSGGALIDTAILTVDRVDTTIEVVQNSSLTPDTVGVPTYDSGTNTWTVEANFTFYEMDIDYISSDKLATPAADDGNATFSVNNFNYAGETTTDDLLMNFQLSTTDMDGDTSALTTDFLTIATIDGSVSSGLIFSDTIFAASHGIDYNDGVVLSGGPSDDTITGGTGNDFMVGNNGSDTIDGGTGGSDTVDYSQETGLSGVTVDLLAGTGVDTFDNTDSLSNIDNVVGTDAVDSITGDGSANLLIGLDGADAINGGGGNDTIVGGDGVDTIDGGSGTNTIDFSLEGGPNGVTVNILTSAWIDSFGNNDASVLNIQNVIGTNFADSITGDNSANQLYGLAGNDTLNGLGGIDTILGDSGADTINGGAGNDILSGNDGVTAADGSRDIFVYDDSSGLGANVDTILDFDEGNNATNDVFDVSGVTGIGSTTIVDGANARVVDDGGGHAEIQVNDGGGWDSAAILSNVTYTGQTVHDVAGNGQFTIA